MKFAEINARFTEKVAEYMAKGYTINTATMNGSQGELGKVDLTNGREIIRVLLDDFGTPCTRIEHRFYSFDGVKLIVGRVTDDVIPNSQSTWQTVWNNRLEVLYREEYYQIGREKRGGVKWYGSKVEAMAQQDKQWKRYKARDVGDRIELPEAFREVVLPFVRRQPRCKSVRISEIKRVTKVLAYHTENHHFKEYARYTVEVRGQSFRLH